MYLVGVDERYIERFAEYLRQSGVLARAWYECCGNEEVVVVPKNFVKDEGFVVEIEEWEGEF